MGVNSTECISVSPRQDGSTAAGRSFLKGEGLSRNTRHLKMASVAPKDSKEHECKVASSADIQICGDKGPEEQAKKKRKFRPAAELWSFEIERPARTYSFTQEEPTRYTTAADHELSDYEGYEEFEDSATIVRGKLRLRSCMKNKSTRTRRLLRDERCYKGGQRVIVACVKRANIDVRKENIEVAVEAKKRNVEKRLRVKHIRRNSQPRDNSAQSDQETKAEDHKDAIVPGLRTAHGAPVMLSALDDVFRQNFTDARANMTALRDLDESCKHERSVHTTKKKRKVQRQRRRAFTRVKETLCMHEQKLYIPDSLRNITAPSRGTKRVVLTTRETSHNTALQRIQAGLSPNLTYHEVIFLLRAHVMHVTRENRRKMSRSKRVETQKKLKKIGRKIYCKELRHLVVQVKGTETYSSRRKAQKSQKYELRHEDLPPSADQSMERLVDLQHRDLTPEDYELLLLLDDAVAPKTVSSKMIRDLKTVRVESSSDAPCAICFDPYEVGQIQKVLNCGHAFHVQCITLWLTNCSSACPLDGIDVSTEPPSDVQVEQQGAQQAAGLVLDPTSDSVDPALREVAELQRRDLTPEDYDMLLRLDERVEPKTVEPAHVDGLETQVVDALVIGDSCAICMEHYELGQTKKILPCKHGFHIMCIENWLKNCSTLCPLDGEPLV
ncbi:PREDICTED: uncharacterized protein LOC109484512 [Branchiostoma belcheri]|uniref:Uncharacterized protein LOC109484512 n=1 Tax=Branchiostoma belcheri TaxID=7741 RepID=A0A6P5AMY1_BRABE|nr:PREDICTED: uncharacterized protein LOC109484512 [Branchiostoma belcheri]